MIRDATPADLPMILEIMNEAIVHTTAIYEYAPQTPAWIEQWLADKQAGNWPVIVYQQDGTVAGYGYYGSFRLRPAYRYTAEHSVYVHSRVRGSGIGGQLLAALIERARQQGLHTLVAGIDAAPYPAALLFMKNMAL